MSKAADGSSSTPATTSYFDQSKKGEVNELKILLRDVGVERDPRKRRDIVRRVIAFQTLGYDCSRLFGEMVMVSSTPDIVVKKMAYQFLSHYARSNQELATLCINTMTKDFRDQDPLVRGLAVRALSSLRLESTLEYLVPVVTAALEDTQPYVRRNGVIAVLKLFHMRPSSVVNEEIGSPEPDLESKLRTMLTQDRDVNVVMACLQTLDELHREQGGLPCDKTLATYLLNRFSEFNEWGMTAVLQIVSRYEPTEQQEMFDAMNVLDPALRQTNSGVVLAATKIFVRYAELVPDIKTAVYLRLKQPILTLIAASGMEIRYGVLCHAALLVNQSPVVFEDAYKSFYIKYDEPACVKFVKLRILPELACEDNVRDLLGELAEYVSDVDAKLACAAIRAVGRIAVKIPSSVDSVAQTLLEFLETTTSLAFSVDETVRAEIVLAIQDLLRRYPDRARELLPALPRCLKSVSGLEDDNGRGRAAAIWMIGEFGELLPEAPYLLELMQREELDATTEAPQRQPVHVKIELLVAGLKLFFKRAPEVRPWLERLLRAMVADVSDTDAHDRALFYLRLLRQDPRLCARIVAGESSARRADFAEDLGELRVQETLMQEFNTVAVVYGRPSRAFVDEAHRFRDPFEGKPRPAVLPLRASSNAATTTTPQSLPDLMDDDWSLNEGHLASAVDQGAFQAAWISLPVAASGERAGAWRGFSTAEIERALNDLGVRCLAFGAIPPSKTKFFFHASDYDGVFYFAELVVDAETGHAAGVVRSSSEDARQGAARMLRVLLLAGLHARASAPAAAAPEEEENLLMM